MNENVPDFRGLITLVFCNKEKSPGKHLKLTSAFSLGTPNPHWLYGPRNVPALSTKNQRVRKKPLNHIDLMEGGTGIKVLWYRE